MKANKNTRRSSVPIHHLSFITHHSPSRRRGVLLLVVLALLAIFALVGVAFVVFTSQAGRSAKSVERIDQGTDPSQPVAAQRLLQQVIMQVLHGPAPDAAGNPNPGSVIGAHSLLEDMYGSVGGTTGTITGCTPTCGGQLLELTTATDLTRYGGCVLTITGPPPTATTTPGYGQSTRIVGFNPTTFAPQIMAFPDGSQPKNATFLVNGVPFSGTGFGFDATGNTLTTAAGTVTNCPVALLPNDLTYNRNPPGGANSDYTAPDFQHVFLAAQVLNGTTVQTLPSMQRSALCRYWANYMASHGGPSPDFTSGSGTAAAAQNLPPDLKRAIILRPLPEDNPNFTGSNPTYTGAGGSASYQSGFNPCWDGVSTFAQMPPPFSWDVDNDGDGVPDSVWIDLGMPVQRDGGRAVVPAAFCDSLRRSRRPGESQHRRLAATGRYVAFKFA